MSFCYILVFVTYFYFYMNHYKQQNENMKFIIYFLVTFFVKMSRWVFLVTWDMSYFTSKCLWLFFNHIWHVVVDVKMLVTIFNHLHSLHMHWIFQIHFGMCDLIIMSFEINNMECTYSLFTENRNDNYCGQTWLTSKSFIIKSHVL
jgi:hypothetical protein